MTVPGSWPSLLCAAAVTHAIPALPAELAAGGVPHATVTFAGEGHGFRRPESQVASLGAELAFYGQVLGFPTPGVAPVALRTS